jgi:WASH complex subunit strumpellin
VTYHADLTKFLSDLNDGYFIQYTQDTLLLDVDGRQLLTEAVYLTGTMLLQLDRRIPGYVRERLVIAYYRYCNSDSSATATADDIDKVCRLVRDTKYVYPENHLGVPSPLPKSPKYEAKLFKRLPLDASVVRSVIGCLTTDDIYLRSTAFPSTYHRSIRLAPQASMLYVCLHFDVATLATNDRAMREIVDRYFNDNWVISLYMGMVVDLTEEWKRYPSAKRALDNVVKLKQVRARANENANSLAKCMGTLGGYLTSGLLTDQYVLDNTADLVNCCRDTNDCIKWRMLHRRTMNADYSAVIHSNGGAKGGANSANGAGQDVHDVELLLNSS